MLSSLQFSKKNGKGYTLDIALLSERTSLLKRSDVAHIVKGFHSFICTPMSTHLCTNGMNHSCLCLPSQSWSSFANPWGMESWVGLGTTMVSKQSAQDRYVTAITVVCCSNHYASLGNWSYECRTHDLSGHKPRCRVVQKTWTSGNFPSTTLTFFYAWLLTFLPSFTPIAEYLEVAHVELLW